MRWRKRFQQGNNPRISQKYIFFYIKTANPAVFFFSQHLRMLRQNETQKRRIIDAVKDKLYHNNGYKNHVLRGGTFVQRPT